MDGSWKHHYFFTCSKNTPFPHSNTQCLWASTTTTPRRRKHKQVLLLDSNSIVTDSIWFGVFDFCSIHSQTDTSKTNQWGSIISTTKASSSSCFLPSSSSASLSDSSSSIPSPLSFLHFSKPHFPRKMPYPKIHLKLRLLQNQFPNWHLLQFLFIFLKMRKIKWLQQKQGNVIISLGIGFQTRWVRLILMKAAISLSLIKIAWLMGGPTGSFWIGGGFRETAICLSLIRGGFFAWCVIRRGHSLVIPYRATMFSPCSACLQRWNNLL